MNIYVQTTFVGSCEIDDEIIPYPPASAAGSSWFYTQT